VRASVHTSTSVPAGSPAAAIEARAPSWRSQTELDQVVQGKAATEAVVDSHGAVGVARAGAVDEHDRRSARGEFVESVVVGVDRGDEHTLDPLLFQAHEVGGLAGGVLVAVAQEQREVGVLGDVLHPEGDVGEEGVRGVEDDVGDGAALAGPKLARRLVADEAELGHRVVHPVTGDLADPVGSVEHVGDGAEGHPGQGGDVLDARGAWGRAVAHGAPVLPDLD